MGSAADEEDDGLTEREREVEAAKKAKFKEERKNHYNEFEEMQRLKAKAALEDEDDY